MRSVCAALTGLFLCLSSAAADCPDWTYPLTFVQSELGESTWVDLPDQQTVNVTVFVNAIDPPTDWQAEQAWFAYTAYDAAIVIDIGDGCAWTSGWRSHGEIDALLRQAAMGGA